MTTGRPAGIIGVMNLAQYEVVTAAGPAVPLGSLLTHPKTHVLFLRHLM